MPAYLGGGRHVILFPDEVPADPEDGMEIQSMLNSGTARLLKDVKIGIPEASAQTMPSNVACVPDRTANYDRTFTLIDPKVTAENVEFYNSLKRRSIAGAMIYECDADRVTMIDATITVAGSRILPDDNLEGQTFTMTASWRGMDDPDIFDAPANIF